MDNKHFVAIGKMTIDNLSTEWNIPDLHFIVNKTPSGLFEATNIELILDAAGSTIEEAIEGLIGLTIHYITAVMEKSRGYDEFIEKVDSLAMEEPTTLTMDNIRAPRRFASRKAASVSAVSPDWLMMIHKVRSSTSGSR